MTRRRWDWVKLVAWLISLVCAASLYLRHHHTTDLAWVILSCIFAGWAGYDLTKKT
jgi:hypothetical protein